MGWYEKWLRFWADDYVIELVDLINNNPGLVRVNGEDAYDVGNLYVYIGGDGPPIRVANEWYWGCNSKLIRRAIAAALVKQLYLPSNEETE